ncbi:MAG TPA: glucosamine-6-phosphate deaminase [Fimbriimonas sp.]|nr:glucosamine-6-phosphate deaminase [Fimbriimonas sp.]
MKIDISQTKMELGQKAAVEGARIIRDAIEVNGTARIVLASAASQFEVIEALVGMTDIDWGKVEAFHLDEYAGMSTNHPASFRKFLKERFLDRLPTPIGAMNYIDGEAELSVECARLGELIRENRIDVAFIGIGENGHLAFNDPPADFETTEPYIVVQLDQACREQQIGEGWFPTLDSVPTTAISMSIRQIMDSRHIVCCVPDTRKANAVRDATKGPVTPAVPASILQHHDDATLYLDTFSAALLG